MLAKIKSFAEAAPAGHWLTGGNWDHTLWANKVLPTRQDLDKVTGDHPAFLDRIDGHISIANTAALKAAGITGKTFPRKAEPSITTRTANQPASYESRLRDSSTKSFRHPATRSADAATNWRSPTRSPTASPACRTSATGRIF